MKFSNSGVHESMVAGDCLASFIRTENSAKVLLVSQVSVGRTHYFSSRVFILL